MKKIGLLLLCSGLLVACSSSDYTSKVSDSDTTLVSGENISVSKQDYFEYLLDYYGANKIISDTLVAIADKEVTDETQINTLLEQRKKDYAEYYDGDLTKYAQSLGFKTEDEYIENALLPDVKQELLRKKYIKDNFDELLTTYQISRFKKITVDKESTALSLIKEATSEDKFDELMDEYGTDAEDADIVTKNSTLDENLTKKLEEFSKVTKDGVYSEAIKLSDDNYAVVYLYDTAHEDKDEYIDAISADDDAKTDIEKYYLKKYNFNVYDEKLKEAIKDISEDYIE